MDDGSGLRKPAMTWAAWLFLSWAILVFVAYHLMNASYYLQKISLFIPLMKGDGG